jgi:nucleoside-diphosphate-sugar epimerase
MTLAQAGFAVRALVRRPASHQNMLHVAPGGVFRCDLSGVIDDAAFRGEIRGLIHCAWTTLSTNATETLRANVEGTEALMELARKSGVRQNIFVSSLSAHDGAVSLYGRTKLQVERLFSSSTDAVLKPGTIIGQGGVFWRTREMLRRLPAVPLFYADHGLQTIWVGDVCKADLAMLERPLCGVRILAHPETTPLRDFYCRIAELDSRRPIFVPFPGGLAIQLTSIAERIGLHLPIHSDNLLGMKHIRWFDPERDLEQLGIRPLSFQESLACLHEKAALGENL